MAKDKDKGENGRVKSHRNLNLLSHYHEYATGVFDNGHGANEYLHNLFIKAAKNGEEQRIQNFLVRSSKNCIVNLNYKDKNTGNTAVVFAASRNHVKVVKMLLNYGADITLLNNQGQSIFDVATDSIIPLLLASVERKGVSNRHLLQAAWQGNLQILQRLLSTQACLDVNCKNADGMTPLLLVTRDVNLFEKIERNVSEKGYNPFEVVKELLQHNADCSITASDGKSPLHYIAHNKGAYAENMANLIIEDSNSQLELPDKSSSLPIHLASRHDNRPVLLALINGGANVNARGHLGQTPLHVAAAQGHECSSSTLLDNGADVRIVDDHGNSPVDVSKGRKVMMVLKEAWMEQTRNYSMYKKRSYSAPTELLTEKELRLAENVTNVESVPDIALPLIAEKQTSPRKVSAEKSNGSSTFSVVKQSNDSQMLQPTKSGPKYVKRSHSMSKVMGDTKAPIKPRLPKTGPNYSNRSKYKSQTRKNSSCSANAGLGCSRQMTELPKLSIKNIELQVSSRSEVPLQLPNNHYASIQRFRLLNNPSTLTRTSIRDHQGCSSRTFYYSSSQGTERIKLPKTLAPLSNEGRRSPDTRQVCSRSSLGSAHGFVGDVLDLDNLQSTSSCNSSFQQMVGFNSEIKGIVVPPTSPCEDSVLKPPPSPCGDEEMKILPSSNGDNELEYKTIKEVDSEESCIIYNNGGNNTENITTNELISTEIKESCNDCFQSDDCHGNGCYKTQTFSSTNLSNFWIPCSKNGETCLGITDNTNKEDKNELDNTNHKNTEITKKIDNEIKGTEIVDETRKDKNRKDSSVFFYVEFGDSKLNDSVNCPTCGKTKDNGKSNECKECTNGVSQKKTFWISLDGETSDGETDASSAIKKCINRNVDSFIGERYSRRTKSLPENKVALDVKLAIASQNFTSDVECDEHVLKEKYLTVHTEDTIKIQEKSSEGSKNKALENVEKKNQDLNSCMKAYSEDTFIIEKNADEKSLSKIGLNQVSSATKVEECDNEAGAENESNMDIKVDVWDDTQQEQQNCNELKSSIVLQSVNMDDDEQHGEKCEENSCTKGTNPHGAEEVGLPSSGECVVSQSDSSRKPIELGDNDAPVLPKSAWSSDLPQEGKPFAIQICNAFPSPVPPINAKPEVQPPIGCNGGNTKPRKNNSAKPKRKISTKESKKDGKKITANEQPSSGKKRKSGKKGKRKKAKETFKEITVNQSLGCSGYGGLPSRGPCELKDNMPSPDLDKVPTLSIDSRATNKLLRGKFPTLSPILESPRSLLLSPATEEVEACSSESFLNTQEPLERSQEFIDELENLRPEERQKGVTVEKVATGDADDVSHGDFATVNSPGKDVKFCNEDVDEVDGGMFSRLFGMCMPHLKIIASDSDFEAQAIRDDSNDDDNDNDNDDDHANVDTTCRYEQLRLPVDETDQDIENMLQNILDNDDHDKKGETAQQGFLNEQLVDSHKLPDQKTSVVTSDCNVLASTSDDSRRYNDNELENNDHDRKEESTQQVLLNKHLVDNHSLPEQETNGVSNDNNVLSSKPEESDPLNGECELRKQGNENKELKETWTRNHVDQISNFLPGEFYSSDDVFTYQGNSDEGCLGGSQDEEEVTSDNDSSYISCESTSRAFSECSTTESCDSYFSSYDSFHGMTLSSHGNTAVESVDINRHEQLHNPQTSITSSNSSITITPNSNSSEISVSSNFSSNSRGEVRSQVCSETGSLSSNTSCGGDIQWQKGSILGKGGFGTVWLGLVNTGELIAVKQVELNNKDENEAEKQYKKLQEEVSLLKSLRHHNIVKYIGTCLDDNFTINIFMEFVPGGSIAQALKRFGAFVEPVFQRYTKQVLSGVEYLHGKNVVHRDIKGGNIMLMRNGVIKLIDFGCAKRLCMNLSLSRNSIMHSMKGTPYWMAPEVIKESSGQGTKSDIWSIGCTVYEMATGNPPWSHMPPMPAMFAIGNGSNVPQLDNTFSKAAREFIAACMTREPSVRPSASDLLHHAFITQ